MAATLGVMARDTYSAFLKRFASNLRRIRKQKGLTQEQMADLGFNYRFYQKLESGAYSPSLNTVYRLSRAMGKPVTDFLGE